MPAEYYCIDADCGWFGNKFLPFSGRLGDLPPGTVVPHGECPECGNHVWKIPDDPLQQHTYECVRSDCSNQDCVEGITIHDVGFSRPECSFCGRLMSRKMLYPEKIKHYAEQAAKADA